MTQSVIISVMCWCKEGYWWGSLLEKLNNILEGQDGYDVSIKQSLSVLESRIGYEVSLQNSNDHKNEKINWTWIF